MQSAIAPVAVAPTQWSSYCPHPFLPLVLAFCLLMLAAGYRQQRDVIADQRGQLRVLARRVENQRRLIVKGPEACYIPYLEAHLARYESGTPGE